MTSGDPLFNSGVVAFQAGRLDEAEQHFTKLLSREPRHLAALNILGVLLASQHKYAQAEPYLREALRINATSDSTLYNHGVVLKGLGRPQEALDSFDKALAIKPDVADTWNNRGTVHNDLRQYEQAIEDFDRAIALLPNNPAAFCNKAKSLEGLGRQAEALATYDKAIALAPSLAEAWLGRGNVLAGEARDAEALDAFSQALTLKPHLVEAWLARGHVLAKHRRHEEAAAAYEQILTLRPDHVDAWLGRGNALIALQRHDEALAAYEKALELNSTSAEAWIGRGTVLHDHKRSAEALLAFDQAIARRPDLAESWLGRGNALCLERRLDEALPCFDKAIALKPDLAAAWNGRGGAFSHLGKYEDAIADLNRALTLDRQLAGAWINRGEVLIQLRQLDNARTSYRTALDLDPKLTEAWVGVGQIALALGDPREAVDLFDRAISIKPDAISISNKIFALDFLEGIGFAEHQKARETWWQEIGSKVARMPAPAAINRDPDRRIVLGYVSADFRRHSAAHVFGPVLRQHDRSQFEIVCYDNSATGDDLTLEFQKHADRWRHVPQLPDDDLAKQIRDDGIDILIDLSGHSNGNRLPVFARKPAPIQVTAWGHATGTGMPAIDYLFSDPVVVPEQYRRLFAERIYDLPCVIAAEASIAQSNIPDPPMLANGHVTFGVFNRPEKYTDTAIQLWARLIDSVPGSRLVIKGGGLEQADRRQPFVEKFASHGIGSDRLTMLGSTPRDQHLAAIQGVDICLDTVLQNGGVSTWEALRMGVPVVCMLGLWTVNRVAASIMSVIGLRDWVADSEDGYLEIARKFASMPDHLLQLRRSLPSLIEASPANLGAYRKAVEAAYRTMWTDFCKSGK